MGRPNRIQFPGACYLIALDGNNRQPLFLGSQDRRHFLALLKESKERHGLGIYAYCLMNHQAHLLLETELPNLSRVMQGFCTAYTKYFNRAHHATGHLFRGRYKSTLIEKEKLLAEMTVHVHLSPTREGWKEKPWRYPWSSCSAYVESGHGESLVESAPVLGAFAKNRLTQSVKYLRYLKGRMKAAADHASSAVSAGRRPGGPGKTASRASPGVLGGPGFMDRVLRASSASPVNVPASAGAAGRILSELASRGVSEESLFGSGRRRELASARKEAVYRIWKEAKLGVTEIGRMFHRTPSAVSQLIRSAELAESEKTKNIKSDT